jgi:hypothetical protein
MRGELIMYRQISILSGALLALTATVAVAHHGWGGNNQAIQVTGTVVAPVDLSGPHGTMQIRDADGQVWDLTLAPAPRTQRAGLTADTLAVGVEVTAFGMRNDSSARFEIKTARVKQGETNYDVYPDRVEQVTAAAAGR